MLTVLAIEESLLREIGDFEPLLQDVAQDGNYKICSWKREGTTLQESIPALFDREFISDGELLNWNILVASDNRSCYARNPFDSVKNEDETEELIDKQLNELAKMLGVMPVHSDAVEHLPENKNSETQFDINIDTTLRDEKLIQYRVEDFTRPERIYLLAVQKLFDVDIHSFEAEKDKIVEKYETFSPKCGYPPNCRFLKFNLSSKSNRTTMSDNFRFWMTLMSFAFNDGVDDIFIAPYALYNIDTIINKKAVCRQITEIYSRVHYVKKYTETRISYIHKMREYKENDHYDIPNLDSSVNVEFESDESGLYLNNRKFGLAKNCPVLDEPQFRYQRDTIERNIKEYLKAPRRAVRKSVSSTKQQGVFHPSIDEFIHLDPEQLEDLNEATDLIEIELMKADEIDINYPKENAELRKKNDKLTYKTMKKRSTVGAILLGSVAMFIAFALCFVPYIIDAAQRVKTIEAVQDTLIVTLICIGIMALCGFVTLIVLKLPLWRNLLTFKDIINDLVGFVNNQADAYTNYLSKLSGFMKRNSFKRYLDSDVDAYLREDEDIYILNRNHCLDVESVCKKWADGMDFDLVYDEKLADSGFVLDENPQYNPVYSFVESDGVRNIKYNKRFSHLEAPYRFIESLNIEREEVYL